MRKKVLWVVIILLGIIRVPASAQVTMGTDFWVSFGDNSRFSAGVVNLQIKVAAYEATEVRFTFTENGSTSTASIAAGEAYLFDIPSGLADAVYYDWSTGTAISSKSLRIQSDKPVHVYALNQRLNSSDATNLFPVNTLGTDYHHISYIPMVGSDGYTIVATENGTAIYDNGDTISLSKGQVYSHYGPFAVALGEDFTGRQITSNKPVAYFVTNTASFIPLPTIMYGENLFQQLMPVNAWGKEIVVPVTRREVERVRIVASQDSTTITQTGGIVQAGGSGTLPTLYKGQFVELEIKLATGGCYISADKPVGVCSYLVGMQHPSVPTPKTGDPSIAMVPSVEQFVDATTIAPFVPNDRTTIDEHYALLVTSTAGLNETTMSIGRARPISLKDSTWISSSNPEYSFCNIELSDATQSYTFANPGRLAILGYGVGPYESYYYLAASAVRNSYTDIKVPASLAGSVSVTNGTLYLKGFSGNVSLDIYNLAGRKLAGYEAVSGSVPVSLDKGIYIVKVKDKGKSFSYKITKN
ncbi:MAG: T9SS type A sorting domain-containing protein [Candidatus Symbiothrix sp.]|jgi:hypothetical protein|nr:T9SS type A sorting domain-containing protein [Candidatus Symbiothrix sp.]